jgi:hypothetical protein
MNALQPLAVANNKRGRDSATYARCTRHPASSSSRCTGRWCRKSRGQSSQQGNGQPPQPGRQGRRRRTERRASGNAARPKGSIVASSLSTLQQSLSPSSGLPTKAHIGRRGEGVLRCSGGAGESERGPWEEEGGRGRGMTKPVPKAVVRFLGVGGKSRNGVGLLQRWKNEQN